MKRWISFLLVLLLLGIGFARADGTMGIWKALYYTPKDGQTVQMQDTGTQLYYIALRDGIGFFLGGLSNTRVEKAPYQMDETGGFVVTMEDGSLQRGDIGANRIILYGPDQVTTVLEQIWRKFPSPVRASRLEDYYGIWRVSFVHTPGGEPYLFTREMIEFTGMTELLDYDLEIDADGARLLKYPEDTFPVRFSNGKLRIGDGTESLEWMDSGEIMLTIGSSSMYFAKESAMQE